MIKLGRYCHAVFQALKFRDEQELSHVFRVEYKTFRTQKGYKDVLALMKDMSQVKPEFRDKSGLADSQYNKLYM